MEAIIFTGMQGAGKSTFYKRYFADTHIRINLDMLKTKRRERLLLECCLKAKQPFVVDKTNASRQERARYINAAKNYRFRAVGYYFRSNFDESWGRNILRAGKAIVPEKGLRDFLRRLETPDYDEGFDALFYVRIDENNEFVVAEWKK